MPGWPSTRIDTSYFENDDAIDMRVTQRPGISNRRSNRNAASRVRMYDALPLPPLLPLNPIQPNPMSGIRSNKNTRPTASIKEEAHTEHPSVCSPPTA